MRQRVSIFFFRSSCSVPDDSQFRVGQAIIVRLEATTPIPIERYEDYHQLGRFTLRDQGQTIAIGKVTRLVTDASSS